MQQFGTPNEIYNRPVNTFVAGFMGSPPMNLIPARLSSKDGKLCAEITVGPTAAKKVLLPLNRFDASAVETLSANATPVLLGLRPEHLTDAGRGNGATASLTVPVDLAEPTGADTLIFITLGGARCIARLHPCAVNGGDEAQLVVDMSAAVLFDVTTQQASAFASV